MPSYKLSPSVKDDLYRLWLYGVEKWGEEAADRYYHAFFTQFEAIAAHPLQYPDVSHIRVGYRRCLCGRDQIFYKLSHEGDTVEIMAIIGQQNTDTWL